MFSQKPKNGEWVQSGGCPWKRRPKMWSHQFCHSYLQKGHSEL